MASMTQDIDPPKIRDEGRDRRAVGLWLVASALMVFAMMIIGAITRLTESGLSMVEWRPLIGFLPPMNEGEWARVFALYKETSQYRLMNSGMSLEAFQEIFFWEWLHRLWGRLIGVVFALPFLWFLIRGRLPTGHAKHGWILLALGGLQGVIGWWMVKSGFVDRTEVSQYRLAVHLGMAFLILGYLVWLALGLLWPMEAGRAPAPRGYRRLGAWCHAVVFFTVISGAIVAGSRAGFIYNDWPDMGGRFIPDPFWNAALGWRNLFETLEVVQFDHRMMAYLTLAVTAAFWLTTCARARTLAPRVRWAAHALMAGVLVQAGLGIAALLTIVWLPVAVLHQAGAATVFCLTLWALKELRGNPA
ncbi:COX15/CtaA family protein [Marivibrio halodurans]|uniref:Heme A synthase n=1 Tax=Marivibrio halodurans TaxID=2039722 RepID=A0A8J7RXM5_9PROT|nr:COX15/CtaA family protein [Marivibrio halodurans]MBP5856637.1 COX15/CtaA family protein [Marivibrio halodurans]